MPMYMAVVPITDLHLTEMHMTKRHVTETHKTHRHMTHMVSDRHACDLMATERQCYLYQAAVPVCT